jgi:hypothetical protein
MFVLLIYEPKILMNIILRQTNSAIPIYDKLFWWYFCELILIPLSKFEISYKISYSLIARYAFIATKIKVK